MNPSTNNPEACGTCQDHHYVCTASGKAPCQNAHKMPDGMEPRKFFPKHDWVPCQDCHGHPASKLETCEKCGGLTNPSENSGKPKKVCVCSTASKSNLEAAREIVKFAWDSREGNTDHFLELGDGLINRIIPAIAAALSAQDARWVKILKDCGCSNCLKHL